MAIDTKTPLALYKANLELVLRLGTLLQENRKRWNQLGASSTSAAIERTLAETERMLTSNDWTSLSAIPSDDFWRSIREGSGPVQGTAQAAVSNQAAFAEGLREAFEAWQQQSVDALGGSGFLPGKFDIAGMMAMFRGPHASVASKEKPASATKSKAKKKPAAKPKAARKSPSRATRATARKKSASAKPVAAKKPVSARKKPAPAKKSGSTSKRR
ncbi:hypothetical protein [Dokdonella sp.]|uniref:hypothetical protein n=1 Tax=Dokdonella sp. TaxID=2291710 RepID=UPI003C4C593E